MNSINKKIAVLGSGVCGLHLALAFVEKGFCVSVFSTKKKLPASLACHGTICNKGYTLARDNLFYEKLEGSHKLLERILFLERETGLKIPHEKGVFEFFQNSEEEKKLRTRIYHRQLSGCFQSEFLRGEKLFKKAQFSSVLFEKKPTGAYAYPESFSFDALSYLDVLKKYLESKGVSFKEVCLQGIKPGIEGYFLLKEDEKEEFSQVLCALGSETESFLKPLNLDLEAFKFSEGLTLRFSFKEKIDPFSAIVSQKNFNALESCLTVGSYDFSQVNKECLDKKCLNTPCLNKGCLNNQAHFFPGFSAGFLSSLLPQQRVFSGVRVYQKSRAPYLKCFLGEKGSKLLVLTGMYKSGFSLAEIYAEKALSFF
jgi:hypothetical protein